jgi:hypothetical protein
MPNHATNGVSPFANVAMSDSTVTEWADRYDELQQHSISIGKHRTDVLGYEFDYDTLTIKSVD